MTIEGLSGNHALLVESNPALARLYTRVLALEGYTVDTLTRAEDVVERFSAVPYDLLVVDPFWGQQDTSMLV